MLQAVRRIAGSSRTRVMAAGLHRRLSLIQEMSNSANPDPAREGLLCFMNDQLFRISVTYDPVKIEGLTAEDRIEAVSATHGVASRRKTKVAFRSNYGEEPEVLARWGNTEYSYNLVRIGNQTSFAMVFCSRRLDGLAHKAGSANKPNFKP